MSTSPIRSVPQVNAKDTILNRIQDNLLGGINGIQARLRDNGIITETGGLAITAHAASGNPTAEGINVTGFGPNGHGVVAHAAPATSGTTGAVGVIGYGTGARQGGIFYAGPDTFGNGVSGQSTALHGVGVVGAGLSTVDGVGVAGYATGAGQAGYFTADPAPATGNNGPGVQAAGGYPNGHGVVGAGMGSGYGINAFGGTTSGVGVGANGGAPNGHGVLAQGAGAGMGVYATGGATAPGVYANSLALGLATAAPTNGGSVTPNAATASVLIITAGAGVASFTVNAPTAPSWAGSHQMIVTVKNASGGVLTTAWNAAFKMAAWVDAANGFKASITFAYDGTNWNEINRSLTVVPN